MLDKTIKLADWNILVSFGEALVGGVRLCVTIARAVLCMAKVQGLGVIRRARF